MTVLGIWLEQPDGGILEIDPALIPAGINLEFQVILREGKTTGFWILGNTGNILARVEAGQA